MAEGLGNARGRKQARGCGVNKSLSSSSSHAGEVARSAGGGTLGRLPPPLLRDTSPVKGEDVGLCSVSIVGTINGTPTTWHLPEEVPVAIMINSTSYAVMMATPDDLQDFTVGFALSEGLVAHASHIDNVLVITSGEGFSVDLAIAENNLIRERMISRSIEGRVGCGLCGIEEMADAIRMPNRKLHEPEFSTVSIAKAFEALPSFQPMNELNRTVHAAAWCSEDGAILLAREDVGRHNALDKLIGAMARGHIKPENGFVLMSSRCSFELVQKCATVGIGALATISAPTALALKLAKQAGLKLAALSKQGIMIFDGV
jgi:FdhD protein